MGRNILIGVTGSIAAYKAAELVRLFVKNGDEVRVLMTPAACEFIAPLTFQTLSRNPVAVDQFAQPAEWKPEHISLAEWADIVLVAPATANTIAKMAYGLADNLLTATLLATRARVAVAPAMNDGMGLPSNAREFRKAAFAWRTCDVARRRRPGLRQARSWAHAGACGHTGGSQVKTIVVIPTYDERENVAAMAKAVLAQDPSVELLFVDDNSPDGTGAEIDRLCAGEPRIRCLHRERKEGLGRAYVAGFRKAIELGADRIVQMDCDFSHDPADISRLMAANADLVIGSRYVPGGGTPGWPFGRRLISRLGGAFIRFMTGMPLRDPTGGFKCWRVEALKAIDFETVESAGYSSSK